MILLETDVLTNILYLEVVSPEDFGPNLYAAMDEVQLLRVDVDMGFMPGSHRRRPPSEICTTHNATGESSSLQQCCNAVLQMIMVTLHFTTIWMERVHTWSFFCWSWSCFVVHPLSIHWSYFVDTSIGVYSMYFGNVAFHIRTCTYLNPRSGDKLLVRSAMKQPFRV